MLKHDIWNIEYFYETGKWIMIPFPHNKVYLRYKCTCFVTDPPPPQKKSCLNFFWISKIDTSSIRTRQDILYN